MTQVGGGPGRVSARQDVTRTERDLLHRAFTAYNAQDADALLALVSEDVDWPDGSSRVQGKDALHAYWTAQWTRTRTHDEPLRIDRRADGRLVVRLTRVVRSLDGRVLDHGTFDDVFGIDAARIVRLDIEDV